MTSSTYTPLLIDSHCHLNQIKLDEFEGHLDNVMKVAHEHGVSHYLCVCITLDDVPILRDIVERYPNVSMSVGVHPNDCVNKPVTASTLIELASTPSCIAIGETGLDYYRTAADDDLDCQRQCFREHIRAAKTLNKPLIIHTREAAEDTLRLLEEEQAQTVGGVLHCFSENWEIARRALDLNFYISFSGIVTFKNATILHDVAKRVPLDRMLIETDSPYLAPVPFRGKQNHPALVKYVAKSLAALRDVSYESIAKATTRNFYDCFKLEVVLP